MKLSAVLTLLGAGGGAGGAGGAGGGAGGAAAVTGPSKGKAWGKRGESRGKQVQQRVSRFLRVQMNPFFTVPVFCEIAPSYPFII